MKKYLVLIVAFWCSQAQAQQVEKVCQGVWKISYGTPEKHLPTEFKAEADIEALEKIAAMDVIPFDLHGVRFRETPKGVVAELKLEELEKIYGFGLQVNTFQQRGMRRDIRCNSLTVGNVGFSHAAMPFFVSSRGYGVLVNTSR
jgi:alpha-D-xyloside xylohydrolase